MSLYVEPYVLTRRQRVLHRLGWRFGRQRFEMVEVTALEPPKVKIPGDLMLVSVGYRSAPRAGSPWVEFSEAPRWWRVIRAPFERVLNRVFAAVWRWTRRFG